ncbi:flagellin [Iodidimonas nitroreducens]|uniref:Flagellin n=2 Tax=Iodidimonas nitroreducens TaxID=1236968 RepID=A0A5A7N4Y2_9PROT|nr:flagellar hook-associated protein FlgL [alpha proteobacterium Q-1]GER03321.1 flagellin [Iodidimonas nitroreducens]
MISLTPSTLGAQMSSASLVKNLQSDIAQFREQSITGNKLDMAAEGPGQSALLIGLRAQFSRIESDMRSLQSFQSRADLKQQAMQSVEGSLTGVLTIAATGLDDLNETMRVSLQTAAKGALDELIAAFNVSDGQRFLFSGIATDRAPMQNFNQINPGTGFSPAQVIENAIAATPPVDAASATALLASIDQIFADTAAAGTNFEETFFNGAPTGSPPSQARISDQVIVDFGPEGNDQALRDIIKGLAVFASFDPAALADDAFPVLMKGAFDSLSSGLDGLRSGAARLGEQQRLAQSLEDRNGALKTILNERVVNLETVDPFETQVRLQALIGQLETSFTLTARIANLSLVNFIR